MENLRFVLDQMYPQFNTISPHHKLTDAINQMCCENVDYLIVMQEDDFSGMISEHDVAQKILAAHKPLHELQVEDVMSRSLPVVNSEESVDYALQLMDRHKTRYLAVYHQFYFRGILSESDLLRQAMRSKKLGVERPLGQGYPWTY